MVRSHGRWILGRIGNVSYAAWSASTWIMAVENCTHSGEHLSFWGILGRDWSMLIHGTELQRALLGQQLEQPHMIALAVVRGDKESSFT